MTAVLYILVSMIVAGACTLVFIGVTSAMWLYAFIMTDEGDNNEDF
jgi:hypothetical protein